MPARLIAIAFALAAAPTVQAQDSVRTEADGTRTLVTEIVAPASPARVWEAIATPEGWRQWAVPHAWNVASDPDLLETAYAPDAKPGDPDNIRQRILAREPGRRLAFRTVKTPRGFPHAEAFMRVTSSFELIPEGTGTRIRLTGAGYPAGAEGDALLGFFEKGNRATLGKLAARLGLDPLDFLAGHCWQGTLPTGEANKHCFTREDDGIRDRHVVLREGKTVYSGETLYVWDAGAQAIRFTYSSGGKQVGQGSVKAIPGGLDFGTSEYGSGDKKFTISTRWLRVGENAYDAADSAPAAPAFDHTVRYTRAD